ncbi:hypothetical protein RhiirB3_378542 [Rhizophagus irregularis]|nr:hypothetical protein RhiirB3_378542 [Rhizophagus irregularis]
MPTAKIFRCFLQGDSQRFPVYVNHGSETLYQLRELIRKGKKSVFRYTDPIDIVLWKIDLPYDEKAKLQNLEHHPDIDTYVEEELHGKALLNPISTIESVFGPALERNHFHIFIKKPVFTVAFKFHEIYNIINELIEERIQQDTPSHVAEFGNELTELCSLGIREGDILRFKKTYTKLLNTEVILSFKVIKIENGKQLLNVDSLEAAEIVHSFLGIPKLSYSSSGADRLSHEVENSSIHLSLRGS